MALLDEFDLAWNEESGWTDKTENFGLGRTLIYPRLTKICRTIYPVTMDDDNPPTECTRCGRICFSGKRCQDCKDKIKLSRKSRSRKEKAFHIPGGGHLSVEEKERRHEIKLSLRAAAAS